MLRATKGVPAMKRPRAKNHLLISRMAQLCVNGKQLAKETGLDPMSISRLLNLRTDAKADTVARLCRALRCKPSDIGYGEV